MALGKSIRIFLADATVTGIRYAELVNWTGQAISCPRSKLIELKEWSEASKPGVYFLFENRFSDLKPRAYIGESENVILRLITHSKEKDFWNDIVILTSKDENLTKAHVKYLESLFFNHAQSADRFIVENNQEPTQSSLPRADRDAMQEFAENARMVLGTLGFNLFEPLVRGPSIADENVKAPSKRNNLNNLIFTVKNLTAQGALTEEGFVIRKGAHISKVTTDSFPDRLHKFRQAKIDDGILEDSGNYYLLKEDLLLNSSSYAAALVAGTSRSGPQGWRGLDGRTLKDLEDEGLDASEVEEISNQEPDGTTID